MPFCSQCGNKVAEQDIFCARCGSRQPVTAPPRPSDLLAGLSPRTAAVLCYIPVVGWIAAVVVLAADQFRGNRTLRFHAFQGLYLFVAWLIAIKVIGPYAAPLRTLPRIPQPAKRSDHLRVDFHDHQSEPG